VPQPRSRDWAAPAGDTTRSSRQLPGDGRARRPRWRRHVPAGGAGGGRGRRADRRRQPRQGRLPVEGEAAELEAGARKVIEGRYRLEERMVARGEVLPAGPEGCGVAFIALNDIVVARGSLARVVRPRRGDRAVAPRRVHRRRPRRRQPDRLHRLLVLGRRPDPRSAEPQPHRHADRGLPLGDPVDRRQPRARSCAAGSSTAHEALVSRSTVARTSSAGRRRRRGPPPRAPDPARRAERGGPFWDLLRQKVQLLPS
jgi:hypothetical protein